MTSTLDPSHPFARLPRTSRREVLLIDGIARWLPPGSVLPLSGLEPALGVEVQVSVGAPRPFRKGAPHAVPRCSEGVILEHVPSGLRGVLELDAPVAIALAWLALDRQLDPSLPAPRALDRVEQGVLLYLVARALWASSGLAGPCRVEGCAPAGGLDQISDLVATVPVTILAGEVSGHGWIHLPRGFERVAAGRPLAGERADLSRLDGLLFGVHVLVGRTEIDLADWARARPGDALLIDEVWARPVGAGWQGAARLRLGSGRSRWSACLDEGGQVTVERQIAHTAQEGGIMVDDAGEQTTKTAVELLEELPVALTVELGSVSLTAQQALELRPGQTLLLGRRPGDPVELRAGAKLLARGDLVDVDGELGVRLVEFFPHRGAS